MNLSPAASLRSPSPRSRLLLRRVAACLLLGLLSACAHQQAPRNPMAQWAPSPNFDERRPNLIVLHFTDQESVEQSLKTLSTRNSGGRVSAHYLIGSDGRIYQLVSESHRAWHAGAGRWGTINEVNSASIGIELDNDGKSPFAAAQIQSLLRLLDDVSTRLEIPKAHVVGHEDIAPTRKRDPGPLFPWRTLAEAGYGHWPRADAAPAPAGFDPWAALHHLGYSLQDRGATVRAFRSHFRGLDGDALDAEDLRLLHDLQDQLLPAPSPAASEVRVSPASDAAAAGMVDVRQLDPGIRTDMRYAGRNNFVGAVVRGYEAPRCYLLQPVAAALARVAEDLRAQDLHLLIYDCYRPAQSVAHFVEWAHDASDQRTKASHYPNLEKPQLLNGYIAATSGHSRGATVDLTLARCEQDRCTPLDMGTDFDFFDPLANTDSPSASPAQLANRRVLRKAMQARGFSNYPMEWWHYTLKPEPAATTAYDFPVR